MTRRQILTWSGAFPALVLGGMAAALVAQGTAPAGPQLEPHGRTVEQHWDVLLSLLLSLPTAIAGREGFRVLERYTKLSEAVKVAKFLVGGVVAFVATMGITIGVTSFDAGRLVIEITGLEPGSILQHGGQWLWQWLLQHKAHKVLAAVECLPDIAAALNRAASASSSSARPAA